VAKDTNFNVVLDDAILKQMIKDAPQEAGRIIRKLAIEGANYVKLSMGTSPAGRTYKRGKVSHTASTPNYPPNVDTGTLRAGIGTEERGQFGQAITSSAEYGPHLELGTSRMGVRPFMRPMFEWLQGEVDSNFKDFI
jgi:hypothetical protein